MKILITGTTGFIGKHLLQRLLHDRHEICAVIRSSTDTTFLKNKKIKFHTFNENTDELVSFIQKEKFDGVVHLASLFLASHETKDIKNLIDSNVFFGTALLEASSKNNVKWFLNTGTFWQHYKNKDYSPVNLYAATKQAFEDIAQYYLETQKINFVTVKLNDTFGQNDTRPKIFNIWNKISKTGETLDMSKGEQIIDICHIDDVVDGFCQMINLLSKDDHKKLNGKSFAITSKERMSLKKLANIFEKTLEKKLNINWGKKEYRVREVMKPWEKGTKIPGWKSKVSIKEGLKRTFSENKND